MNNKISEMRFKVIDPTKEAVRSKLSANLCEAIEMVLVSFDMIGTANYPTLALLKQAYIDEVKE